MVNARLLIEVFSLFMQLCLQALVRLQQKVEKYNITFMVSHLWVLIIIVYHLSGCWADQWIAEENKIAQHNNKTLSVFSEEIEMQIEKQECVSFCVTLHFTVCKEHAHFLHPSVLVVLWLQLHIIAFLICKIYMFFLLLIHSVGGKNFWFVFCD